MSLLEGRLATLLRSRRVVALGVLVAALGVARGVQALRGDGYEPAAPLARFEVSEVARIELSRGEAAVNLVRGEGGWVVASHGGLPAHGRVDQILARVRSWRRERVAGDDPEAEAEWNVDGAQTRRLVLRDGDGATLADLRIGGITGIEREDLRESGYSVDTDTLGLFVRAGDEPRVYVVTEFVTGDLEPEPGRWYRQPALAVDVNGLRALAVSRAGARAVVALHPAPRFVDDPRPVDALALRGLLFHLARIVVVGPAEALPPDDAVAFELDPARGEPLTLRVWEDDGRYYAALPERTLEVGRLAGANLSDWGPRQLVRRRWSLQAPRQVVLLRIARPDGEDRLERLPGERWRYTRTVDGVSRQLEVAGARIDPFVHALVGLEVTAWSPTPADQDLPWRMVTRDAQGGEAAIAFAPRAGGPWLATVEDAGGARVDGTLLRQLLDRLAALHD